MIVALRRLAAGAAILIAVPCALAAAPVPATAATSGFNALAAPQRVLDTRPGGTTADNQHAKSGVVGEGATYRLPLTGRVGLPDQMAAAVLNVTVTEPGAAGFVTVYPCGAPLPTASNLNYTSGQTVPNAVIAAPGERGAVCLFTKSATHLIVDVSGWFATGAYTALKTPARLYESRAGRPTVDGRQRGEGLRPAESETRIKVAGRGGVSSAPASVVLNVTATETQGPGFVTVYPCGVARPNASNLNYLANQTVPNLVVAKVGADGEVCVFTKAAAHLVIDIAGELADAVYAPLASPQRLLDTRPTGTTADGAFQRAGTQPHRASLQLNVARAGVPADASAVVLNITAVGAQGPGYVAAHPRGSARPTASNVNYAPGQTVANAVVARVGTGGHVCIFNLAPTDVIVDVAGYLTGPAPATSSGQCPGTQPDDPNAAAAIVRRPVLHQALGNDRIAILICDVGANFTRLDAGQVATWANEHVAPWFAEESRGRFTVQFSAHPSGRIRTANAYTCMDEAADLTEAPFTNVIGVTEEAWGGGQAGPGYIYDQFDTNVLAQPPSESARGGYVGGQAAFVNPSVFVHEIGHTIHWPHSYIYVPNDPFTEYNNRVDVMSGEPEADFDSANYCDIPGTGSFTPCFAQHTLAFNRVAAGWVGGTQVAIHRSGQANYVLDAPIGNGVQMVALPDRGDPNQLMTIEARPAVGRDQFLEVAGVAVHLVDQTGDGYSTGVSTSRRQQQAAGEPDSYGHVVAPGQTLRVHGVTIRVYGTAGGGYAVEVSGSYRTPGHLPGDRPVIITHSTDDGVSLTRIE
ncbi:MAG TPA: hypothetical protein VNQ73_13060 [Ilumatobacter sp.]|nr:hypothetical protein [Ilumatobacter sp.]